MRNSKNNPENRCEMMGLNFMVKNLIQYQENTSKLCCDELRK